MEASLRMNGEDKVSPGFTELSGIFVVLMTKFHSFRPNYVIGCLT